MAQDEQPPVNETIAVDQVVDEVLAIIGKQRIEEISKLRAEYAAALENAQSTAEKMLKIRGPH